MLGKPLSTWEELEKTYRFVSQVRPDLFGATLPQATLARTEAERRALSLAHNDAVTPMPTNSEGKAGNQNARKEKPKIDGSHTTVDLPQDRGAGYLVRRLKRDHPEIVERMKAGEFRSVRAAAIEAGIVKVPTPSAVVAAPAIATASWRGWGWAQVPIEHLLSLVRIALNWDRLCATCPESGQMGRDRALSLIAASNGAGRIMRKSA